MEKVHELFQTGELGCVQILELHRKNAEKNQSKGFEMNGKKRKPAIDGSYPKQNYQKYFFQWYLLKKL